MVEQIIGKYMVESGKLSQEQLTLVLEKQDSTRIKLGFLAVEAGFMTTEQTNEVNDLQAAMDKRFGDLAIEKGYLTEEQVDELLAKQGNPYLSFTQTLLDNGLIQMDEIDALVSEFQKARGLSDEQLESLKKDDVDAIIPMFMPAEGMKYLQLVGTVVRTLIRFVDRHAYIGSASMESEFPEKDQVNQSLIWEEGLVDSFSEKSGGLLKLCKAFAHEDFPRIDEDSLDAAGELLNCANGLYVSALSRQGEFLEIIPPNYGKCESEIVEGSICKVPIFIGNDELSYCVAEVR